MLNQEMPVFSDANVMVIGDIMLDTYLIGDTNRISPEAPVPVLLVERRQDLPGGAANVALNLATLGCQAYLTGICGKDEAGRALNAKVTNAGVQFTAIESATVDTIVKQRLICQSQQMLRVDYETTMPDCTQQFVNMLLERIDELHLIVLSDYAKGTLVGVQHIIEVANENDTPVFVDPKGNDYQKYRGASVLTPNIHEFEQVVGACRQEQELIEKGMAMIDTLQLDALLVTRGKHGMTLLARDGMCQHNELHIPALAREVYDVTGAGDTVMATLAAAYAAGWSLEKSVMLGNMAAALVVSKSGTVAISNEELKQHINKQGSASKGIINEDQLLSLIEESRARGEKIIMTNGCFDIIHAGHVHYLERAKALGDKLIVLINDDESVRRIKGNDRPINTVNRRMSVIAGLSSVDWVTMFADDTPRRLISLIQPDILVKGGDYSSVKQVVGYDTVHAYGGEVRVLDHVEGVSSTLLANRLSTAQDK